MAPTNTAEQYTLDAAKLAHDHGSHDFSDVYKGIVQLQQQDKGDQTKLQADMKDLNTKLHAQGILPGLDLTGTDGQNHLTAVKDGKSVNIVASDVSDTFQSGKSTSWWQGAENVGGSLLKGAWNELTEHPLKLAADAAIGVGVGIAATLAAPEVVAGVAIAGAAVGAYELATHVGGWIHDAKVVANPNQYSAKEGQKAEKGLEDVGAGGLDVAVGIAGGVAGAKIAGTAAFGALKDAIIPKTAAVETTTETTEVAGAVGRTAPPVETAPVTPPPAEVLPPAPAAVEVGSESSAGSAGSQRFDIPKLKITNVGNEYQGTIPGMGDVFVNVEPKGIGVVSVDGLYRGNLPPGSGGDLLAKMLTDLKLTPDKGLIIKNISNAPTLEAFNAGEAPESSVLGKAATKALEILQLKPVSYAFVKDSLGHLDMVIKTIPWK